VLTTSITPADIATALGRPIPDEGSTSANQWQMWIDDATMLVTVRAEALAVTDIDAAKLDYVVREAVVAQVRRPDDATQVTVSVDDGSTSRTYQRGTGRVTILDEWWTLLGLAGDGSAAYAIDTYAGPDMRHGHADVCSIFFGSSNCSCGAYLTLGSYPLYEIGGA